jgi:hypothetical protein
MSRNSQHHDLRCVKPPDEGNGMSRNICTQQVHATMLIKLRKSNQKLVTKFMRSRLHHFFLRFYENRHNNMYLFSYGSVHLKNNVPMEGYRLSQMDRLRFNDIWVQ